MDPKDRLCEIGSVSGALLQEFIGKVDKISYTLTFEMPPTEGLAWCGISQKVLLEWF